MKVSSHLAKLSLLLCVIIICISVFSTVGISVAASTMSGIWNGTTITMSGEVFSFSLNLSQQDNNIIGNHSWSNNVTGTISGTVTYPTIVWTRTDTQSSYRAFFTGQISEDFERMTGTWNDTNGNSGTFTSTKRANIYLPLLRRAVDLQAITPFKSQWDENAGSGWNNCGPASVAMTMAYYRKDISVEDAARRIRGSSNPYLNTTTDFKSENTKRLLADNGLELIQVNSLESMKAQLNLKRPVIMLVYNDYYVRNDELLKQMVPYIRREGFSKYTNKDGTVTLVRHVVVVTGYNSSNIYINDPLAVTFQGSKVIADSQVGRNFAVPIEIFERAVENLGWYGAAVATK